MIYIYIWEDVLNILQCRFRLRLLNRQNCWGVYSKEDYVEVIKNLMCYMGWVCMFHGMWFLAGTGKWFFLCTSVQISSGAHPNSYAMDTRVFSLQVKGTGCEGDCSSPMSAEVKNTSNYTSTPTIVLMVWCLVKQRIYLCGIVLS